jgi:hypothetical protein
MEAGRTSHRAAPTRCVAKAPRAKRPSRNFRNATITIDSLVSRLDEPAKILWNRSASAADLNAALGTTRSVLLAIDEAEAAARDRRAQGLAAMTPPPAVLGQLDAGRTRIDQVLAALVSLHKEAEQRSALRETAVSLSDQITAAAGEAKKAEALRDEARKPFEAQSRRAQDLAKRCADYPRMAERIVSLFRTDVMVTVAGRSALSRCPRPRGSAIAYDVTFDVPRTIAVDSVLKATKLPGFWPPKHSDFTSIERFDLKGDTSIVAPLEDLTKSHDDRRIVLSDEATDRAIARAQATLLSEFRKVVGALRELLGLDAEVNPADRGARYPDGALIYDPMMFPENWDGGRMSRRVVLPSIGGMAMAAE